MKNNKIVYEKVRNNIRNGDVLLYKGKGILSYIIQKGTRSEYSHSGIAAWWNDRLMVMEVIRKGVVVTAISRNVSRYHGDIEWYTAKNNISKDQRVLMIRFAQKKLGHEYNFLELFTIAVKIIFNKIIKLKKFKDERLICSQYVAEIYKAIGIEIKKNVVPSLITPADIAWSKELRFNGVLKTE